MAPWSCGPSPGRAEKLGASFRAKFALPDDPSILKRSMPRTKSAGRSDLSRNFRKVCFGSAPQAIRLAAGLQLCMQGVELSRERGVDGADFGWRGRGRRCDELRESGYEPSEPGIRLRVAAGEFRDRLESIRFVPAAEQVASIGKRLERRLLRDHLESMGGEVQVPDHLGTKQAAYVGADDELETREHFLRDRGADERVTTFEDEDPLAGARKVGGGHEAVVSPADHDRLILRCQGDDLLRRSVDDHQKTRGAAARNGGGVITFLRGPRYQ